MRSQQITNVLNPISLSYPAVRQPPPSPWHPLIPYTANKAMPLIPPEPYKGALSQRIRSSVAPNKGVE